MNGVTTKYYLVGDELHGELRNGKDIIYRYDQNGQCYGFQYDGSFFYFEFNGQGDVIRLLNSDGTVRANYAYDAWGKVLSVTDANGNEITDPNHMGRINPIRYRGYYYDEETGLYYLNSRYYDPVTGRFLCTDSFLYLRTGIIGINAFAYCNNNPVNYSDPTGKITYYNWQIQCWITTTATGTAIYDYDTPAPNISKNIFERWNQFTFHSTGVSVTQGLNANVDLGGVNLGVTVGLAFDAKGNIALQVSPEGGLGTGTPSVSLSIVDSISNVPTVKDLEGMSYNLGGGVIVPTEYVPIAASGDIVIVPDPYHKNSPWWGISGGIGVGTGAGGSVHINMTDTYNLYTFNVFDVINSIKEFFGG